MKLRPYQSNLTDQILELPSTARCCVCAPTGAGKTVIFSEVCSRLITEVWKPCQILIIVHMDVLILQTISKLQASGFYNTGIVAGRYKEDRRMAVQVSSVQTLSRRDWWRLQPWKLVILDEAHTTAFSSPGKWLMNNLQTKRVGFTATPYRLNKKEGMKTYFDFLLAAPTPSELQEDGYLCKMRYFSLKQQTDLRGVKTRSGEYISSDLSNACNTPELIEAAIADWKEKAFGRRTLAFCVDLKHAIAVVSKFLDASIPAAIVTGETPIKQRKSVYEQLERGEIKVLASCMVVSIGFDSPLVDCLLLLRPTKSKAIHFQQIGRGMRTASGKQDCIVLDQAGNCRSLSIPERMRRFTLDKAKESKGNVPMKECPQCRELHYGWVSECSCGYKWIRRIKQESELEEIKVKSLKKIKFPFEQKKVFHHEDRDFVQLRLF